MPPETARPLQLVPEAAIETVGETLTHCPYCALNCGLKLHSEHEQVVGIGRWKQSPLSRGALCTKGVHAHEQINHGDRLRKPLVKRDGRFVEVDWDEALDAAATGFQEIAAASGAAANAMLSGGSLTNEKVYLVGKFARLALKTPHVDYNGRFCMVAAGTAHKRAFGADRMMTPFAELDNADLAVVVGANLSAAFPIVVPQALARLRRRGGRVLVIDPRGSRFVNADDLHLAIRPGSDRVLFNGLLRAVDRAGHTDMAFVRDRTNNFNAALAECEPFDPETVATLADIAVEDFAEAAELIGRSERCMYLHGRGPEQQLDGTANVASIINLGLARGHVGKPGCGINMLTGQRNGQGGREWGQRCNQLPAGRDIDDDDDRAIVAAHWSIAPEELPRSGKTYVEILQMAGRGEIRGLLSMGTNMNVSSPDLEAVEQQMAALDHVVMIEPFFSQACEFADVILPGSVWAEEEGTITTIEGRVVRIDQAAEPVAKLSDIDVISALAERLGAGEHFSFGTGREVFDEMRAVSAGGSNDYSGMSWKRIRTDDGLFWPCPSDDHPGTPQLYQQQFFHDDGRARFQPVAALADSTPTDPDYPLVLTTGRVLAHFLSGNQTMRIASHQQHASGPQLEVHPSTAEKLKLRSGQRVVVSSRLAASTVAWQPNEAVREDTVFLPYHWVECNRLVAADLDPESGIPGFKYTAVRVEPAPPRVSIPPPHGTTCYPVNLDLSGRAVLVVGGGAVASQKIVAMLRAGAHVTVVAPIIAERIKIRAATNIADEKSGRLTVRQRRYIPADLDDIWLVLACTDNPQINRQVHVDAEARHLWSNSADDPVNCAWTLPSVARQGDLQLTISTNGRSPALSKWLRKRFEHDFDDRWLAVLEVLADVRETARQECGTSELKGWLDGLDNGAIDLALAGDPDAARAVLIDALGLTSSRSAL